MIDRARHRDVYTALHEGRPPERFIEEPIPRRPRRVEVIGRITEIQYWKLVPSGEDRMWHPFAEHAQPKLGIDESGRFHIYAGRYVVTDRGIEDRKQSSIQSEFLPNKPRSLTDIGKLEWIKYQWYDQSSIQTDEILFSQHASPILSHDENGNLHVLRGSKQTGVETMARSRSRSHRRHRGYRRNPTEMGSGSRLQRAMLGALVVGSIGAATIVSLDMLLARWPTLTGATKAFVKIGIGVAGATLLGKYVPPAVAVGIGAGGVTDGALDLWTIYGAPRLAAMNTPATNPAPGMRALPAGYAPFSAASCAVPQMAGIRR